MEDKQDCIYILLCADHTLYTGWSNNLPKRLADHQAGQGAKYTRSRLPVQLVYYERLSSKNEAMQREYEIKQLSKSEKIKLIETALNKRAYEFEQCGLSTEEVQEIFSQFKVKGAQEKALKLLARSAYSSGMLEEKLCRSFDKISAKKAVARMKEFGYLDDEDYGQRLALALHKNKGYSCRRIRQELYKRQINERLIEEIMAGFGDATEVNAIVRLLHKKYRNNLMDPKDLEKTIAGLIRRGFKYSHIRQALEQAEQGEFLEIMDERIDDAFKA